MRAEVQLLVRVDPKIKRALDNLSHKTDRTVSDHVREALKRYLDTVKPLTAPAE